MEKHGFMSVFKCPAIQYGQLQHKSGQKSAPTRPHESTVWNASVRLAAWPDAAMPDAQSGVLFAGANTAVAASISAVLEI